MTARKSPRDSLEAQLGDAPQTEAVDPHDGPVHESREALVYGEKLSEPVHWIDPSTLDAPPPRPGYVQKWGQIGVLDEAKMKVRKNVREGWRPRPADTVPAEFAYGTMSDSRFAGAIVVGDLCLMEMPEKISAQKRKHRDSLRQRQLSSIGERLKTLSKASGLNVYVEDESTVTTGGEPS